MFNPRPHIQAVPLPGGAACYVVDAALREPERWVEIAHAQRHRFEDSSRNAFPGPELGFAPNVVAQIGDFFNAHVRGLLGGRRTLRCTARMSLVTRAPSELQPWQCFCHTDRMGIEPGQMIAAAVLYLFRDSELGGTSFYVPLRPPPKVMELIQASRVLPADEFASRYGIARSYMTGSNDWFRQVTSIQARWNRMIFYPGTMLHSGDVRHPERLDTDPRRGRLTVNAFFTCTRRRTA